MSFSVDDTILSVAPTQAPSHIRVGVYAGSGFGFKAGLQNVAGNMKVARLFDILGFVTDPRFSVLCARVLNPVLRGYGSTVALSVKHGVCMCGQVVQSGVSGRGKQSFCFCPQCPQKAGFR